MSGRPLRKASSSPKSRESVRILLADDHEIMRFGLRALLASKPGYEVVGEAADGEAAVAAALDLRPDVVILDISMPVLDGLEATRRIAAKLPSAEILILTFHDSEEMIRDVIAAGAHGYLLKTDACRDLLSAIDTLCAHRRFFSASVSELILEGYVDDLRRPESPRARLTSRELEVVRALADGKSNKETGLRLGVTEKTIEAHRANMMNKLGLRSTIELVRYAIRHGIIEA
jgi:DNA-binding NarL/FixJ family response regulator